MGNCLFSQGADDLSLLNESEGGSLPGEPPPPYEVRSPGLQVKLSSGIQRVALITKYDGQEMDDSESTVIT